MPRMGLNQQKVVSAAVAFIEEQGFEKFSMRELAERLQVKTAALYNHIESMDALHTQVGYYAISKLRQAQLSAVQGKNREDAVRALAEAFYGFAREHPQLYQVIMALPMTKDDALLHAAGGIVEPIMGVLSQYDLDEAQKMHLQRVLRSILHGFITQEAAGCFRQFPVDIADSFRLALDCFLSSLHTMEERNHANR